MNNQDQDKQTQRRVNLINKVIHSETHSYRITELLGGGKMASIFKAVRLEDNLECGIKLAEPNILEDLARFHLEGVYGLEKLNHPNLVKILDFCDDYEQPFIAMELVEGRNLEDILKEKESSLELTEVYRIIDQASEALDYLASCGIIHRDLKPSNIMYHNGKIKIIDFGIAKFSKKLGVTQKGYILGSPFYMSPEQLSQPDSLTPMNDVYALGVIFYLLVTGTLPITGDELDDIIFKKVNGFTPEKPCEINKEIPKAISDLIISMMHTKASKRPQPKKIQKILRKYYEG